MSRAVRWRIDTNSLIIHALLFETHEQQVEGASMHRNNPPPNAFAALLATADGMRCWAALFTVRLTLAASPQEYTLIRPSLIQLISH